MSLPIEEWRRIHAESIVNAGGSFEIETDEALRIAARDHLPALLDELAELRAYRATNEIALRENLRRDEVYLIARQTEELAELRNLVAFVATKLRIEEEARSDSLPCKATSARDEALTALAKHAGPWSPECAALSTYTMLDHACREIAELRAMLDGACREASGPRIWREPKAGEGGGA